MTILLSFFLLILFRLIENYFFVCEFKARGLFDLSSKTVIKNHWKEECLRFSSNNVIIDKEGLHYYEAEQYQVFLIIQFNVI